MRYEVQLCHPSGGWVEAGHEREGLIHELEMARGLTNPPRIL